jgi:hypothetical protein
MAKKPAKTVAAEAIATAATSTVTSTEVSKFKHAKNLALEGKIEKEAEITWFVTTNPRSKGRGTYDRFEKYLGAATVEAYYAAGGTLGDLRWDIRSGYLAVAGVTLGGELQARKVADPKAPKAKKVKAEKTEEQAAAESDLAAATQDETID